VAHLRGVTPYLLATAQKSRSVLPLCNSAITQRSTTYRKVAHAWTFVLLQVFVVEHVNAGRRLVCDVAVQSALWRKGLLNAFGSLAVGLQSPTCISRCSLTKLVHVASYSCQIASL
jgi:hypothetical protein